MQAIAVTAVETEDGMQSLCLTTDVCALFRALRKMCLSMSVPMQLVALIGRLATSAQSNRAKQKIMKMALRKKARQECVHVRRASKSSWSWSSPETQRGRSVSRKLQQGHKTGPANCFQGSQLVSSHGSYHWYARCKMHHTVF